MSDLDNLYDRKVAELFLAKSEDRLGDIAALLKDRQRLGAVRKLVEQWSEERDGPDAADFFVQLRPLLGIEGDDE